MGKTPKVAPLPIAEVSNTKDNSSLETLTEEMISDLETAFRLFDSDGSGTITAKELKQVFETLGQKPTDDELASMLKEVDSDGSGAIDLEEFCQLMVTRMNDPDDPNLLKEAFKILDADNSGGASAHAPHRSIHLCIQPTPLCSLPRALCCHCRLYHARGA